MRLFKVCCLVLMVGCSEKGAEQEEPVIRPVHVDRVAVQGGERVRDFNGTARSGLESKLSFRVPGTIEKLAVKQGDKVKKGAVIAQLDDRDYRLQVDDTQANLSQAEAQLRSADANYERIRGLYEHNSVSINDLDAARATMESAQAQRESIRNKLALIRSQLDYTVLKAPLDGLIAMTSAEVNENVVAGQVVATLNAGTRPETTFAVPEQLIAGIKEGDAVQVTFDAIPEAVFAATVTEVGVSAGDFATTYPVIARLDDPNAEVRQGMVASISVTFGSVNDKKMVVIKPKAVVQDAKGRFVYVAEPTDGGLAVVKRRTVEVGALMGDGMEITTGLSDGDFVITAGIRFLNEGMTVRMPDGE